MFRLWRKLFSGQENITRKEGQKPLFFCNYQINQYFIEYVFKNNENLVFQIFVALVKPIVYTDLCMRSLAPLVLVVSKCC